MNQHEIWSLMTPAEKLVQRKTGFFTWSWMNMFVREEIRQCMIDLANEVLRLRRQLKKQLKVRV